MKTQITYYRRQNYGVTCYYVSDPKQASFIEDLTGKKTLTAKAMEALKGLGFELVEILQ